MELIRKENPAEDFSSLRAETQIPQEELSPPRIALTKAGSSTAWGKGLKNFLKGEDYCLRAEELLQKRRWEAAQRILQKGILEVEKKGRACHLLGIAFYHQGFFQKALLEFQKACETEPEAECFLNLSIALNELGRYEEGKKAYHRALQIKSLSRKQNLKQEISKRHHLTAEMYLKDGQLRSALNEYIKSFKAHQSLFACRQIARLLWDLNQPESALKHLKNLINLYPQDIEARLLLAKWLFESHKPAEAVNEWESVLAVEPQNQEALNCLKKAQTIQEPF